MAPLSYALLNEVLQYPQPCEAPVCREVPNSTAQNSNCLLYTSPSPRDRQKSRMPSSA